MGTQTIDSIMFDLAKIGPVNLFWTRNWSHLNTRDREFKPGTKRLTQAASVRRKEERGGTGTRAVCQ